LVRTCPTWSWEAGDKAKAKAYLPKDKQYLVTRNVPSNQRASAIEQYGEKMEGEGLKDEGDGWFSTAETPGGGGAAEDIPNIDGSATRAADPPPNNSAGGEEEDDDIPDIDDLALDDEEEDEAAVPGKAEAEEDHIVHTRTYDLLISYDKYYQVPRFWLVGYNEQRQPLTPKQVLEDVSEEHARKTITVDPFPHSSVVAASIHPCKHAPVMMKLGAMAEAGGKEFRVENYLILFLKFIASVVPSIEYDYTMAAGW